MLSSTLGVTVNRQIIVNSREGNGYETRQTSLLYVIVLRFGNDPAQNTLVVYCELRN